MNVLEMIEKEQMRGDIPAFKTGDTVKFRLLKAWSSASAAATAGQISRFGRCPTASA